MSHPAALRHDKPSYGADGATHYNFNVFTLEPDPKDPENPDLRIPSKELTLFALHANNSDWRWGVLSATALGIRQAASGSWSTFKKKSIDPGLPDSTYHLRGQTITDMCNMKTKEMSTHFVQFSGEEFLANWNVLEDFWNHNYATGQTEPLSQANVWWFKRILEIASKNPYITGDHELFNTRKLWLNGPPLANDPKNDRSEEEHAKPFLANRAAFYKLAANPETGSLGRSVKWVIR